MSENRCHCAQRKHDTIRLFWVLCKLNICGRFCFLWKFITFNWPEPKANVKKKQTKRVYAHSRNVFWLYRAYYFKSICQNMSFFHTVSRTSVRLFSYFVLITNNMFMIKNSIYWSNIIFEESFDFQPQRTHTLLVTRDGSSYTFLYLYSFSVSLI